MLIEKISAVKTASLRNLVVVLALFNLCTIFYVRAAIKSASDSDPVAESNLINQVVLYHVFGSLLMGGGMLAATLDLNDKDE